MPQNPPPLPDFTRWPSFPFEGDMRVKPLAEPVEVEPPRSGEDAADCVACNTPDDAYIWVSERWRVRGMDRPTGLPMVLILECRSHLDIGDLPNLLAAELGVMTVRLERSIRSLDGVARVHVNRWGDGSAHLHMWFLARPYGRLQLRGTFLSLWDDILPVIPEEQWLENLALVAEWLAGFGGRAIAEPPHIHWQSPSTFSNEPTITPDTTPIPDAWHPADPTDSPSAGFTWNTATPGQPAADAVAPETSTATGSGPAGAASGTSTATGSGPAGAASGTSTATSSGPGGVASESSRHEGSASSNSGSDEHGSTGSAPDRTQPARPAPADSQSDGPGSVGSLDDDSQLATAQSHDSQLATAPSDEARQAGSTSDGSPAAASRT